jgi:hypothetical protein
MPMAEEPGVDRSEPVDEGLTTADFAGAGRPAETPQAEPRTFADDATPQGAATRDEPRGEAGTAPLFAPSEADDLRGRWDSVQAGFVDEPRRAVEQADSLVAGTMKRLAEMFAEERANLEGQWDRGDDVSTEDLRLALQRYRSFFGRLLSI